MPAIVEQAAVNSTPHDIELDVGGDRVRIGHGADVRMMTTIIRAVTAAK